MSMIYSRTRARAHASVCMQVQRTAHAQAPFPPTSCPLGVGRRRVVPRAAALGRQLPHAPPPRAARRAERDRVVSGHPQQLERRGAVERRRAGRAGRRAAEAGRGAYQVVDALKQAPLRGWGGGGCDGSQRPHWIGATPGRNKARRQRVLSGPSAQGANCEQPRHSSNSAVCAPAGVAAVVGRVCPLCTQRPVIPQPDTGEQHTTQRTCRLPPPSSAEYAECASSSSPAASSCPTASSCRSVGQ